MTILRISLVLAALVTALASAAYLSGCIYFILCKVMPAGVGVDTWLRYWDAYGADPVQRTRLLTAITIAIAVTVGAPATAFVSLNNQRRPLHGSARWATHAEIKKAGLL